MDWYEVDLATCGTLIINLTGLPYDYDLELYGAGCLSQWINGSYNSSTSDEQITYANNTSGPITLYIKVYPYNSSNYTTASCYHLNFDWVSSPCNGGSCVTSVNPIAANVGASGGSYQFNIYSPTNCNYVVSTLANWVHFPWGAACSGNCTMPYAVDANPYATGRTAIVDVDAGVTFTINQSGNTTGIKQLILNSKVEVYPNPTTDGTINLKFVSIVNANATVEIRNVLGEIIHKNSFEITLGENIKQIDLAKAESGVYFVNVTVDKNIYRNKIIKE